MDRPGLSRFLSGLAAASGLIFLLTFVMVTWFLWPRYMPQIIEIMSPLPAGDKGVDFPTAGTFGDQFGGINALFTALALVGVIWTAIAQMKDRAILEKQSFENTFFNMLTLLRQSYEGIQVDVGNNYQGEAETLTGDAAAEFFTRRFTNHLASSNLQLASMTEGEVKNAYIRSIHNSSEALISVYFRTMYNLLRLIDRSRSLNRSDRVLYGNILRAQISSNSLQIIGLNAIDAELSGDFKHYVEKYRLLRYIPDGDFREMLQRFYSPETFERRRD